MDWRKKPRKREPVGRPSTLTDEILLGIKELILQGDSHKNIQTKLDIPKGTWDMWINQNYQAFADKLVLYNHQYKISLAEGNLIRHLKMETMEPVIGMFGPIVDKKTKKPVVRQNDKLLKIKSDNSLFVLETLGRQNYTKRSEIDDITKKKRILLG